MSCSVAVRPQCSLAHVDLEQPEASPLTRSLEPNPILVTPSANGRSRGADTLTHATREPGASMLPAITITDATPQKTLDAHALAGQSTPTSTLASITHTPASSERDTDAPYRLLYRGALSLPDSYLQLDGIAFSARLPGRQTCTSGSAGALQDSPSCALARSDASTRELMYNPLALALESMRGRQTLRFKGTVRLRDVWTDDTGDVYMDIHPCATLTRIYFENTLCLAPLETSPYDAFGPKRTEVGVRVSLGDTDGPETTDIVIYGETSTLLHPPPLQLFPATASVSAGPPPLSVRVARITPAPRAPRPDDPTPRQPPTRFFGDNTLGDLGANTRVMARPSVGKDKAKVDDPVLRRAREVMLHLPRPEGSANRSGKGKGKEREKGVRDTVFKVPQLPAKARLKQGDAGIDVFGAVEPLRPRSTNGKGKCKAGDGETGNAIEEANKRVLKKLTVLHLANAGMSRSHDEFKDVFGFVYRGTSFALRSQMKTMHVSAQAAEAVVEAHVKLYVLDVAHDPAGLQAKTSLNMMVVNDAGG